PLSLSLSLSLFCYINLFLPLFFIFFFESNSPYNEYIFYYLGRQLGNNIFSSPFVNNNFNIRRERSTSHKTLRLEIADHTAEEGMRKATSTVTIDPKMKVAS
ncbi:hypothetical protein Prudu_006009, partial [Prunus dulcis]